MKLITKTFLFTTISFGFVGCATISEKALSVQVQYQDSNLFQFNDCKALGNVSSKADNLMYVESAARANAKTILREKTADLGGDTVVVTNIDSFTSDVYAQGVALKCYNK